MAETKMRIKIRRDLSTNWTSVNPTLLIGEQGYETDTGKMKIGDGSTRWNALSYFANTLLTMEGTFPSSRVTTSEENKTKLTSLPGYGNSSAIETQENANRILIDSVSNVAGRIFNIEQLDLEGDYATKQYVDSSLQVEAKARNDYDNYIVGLINNQSQDIELLDSTAVRRAGDTMTGGLKISNTNGYKYEIIPQTTGRPAGTTKFTYNDQTAAEMYWDPENKHIDFSFPLLNRIDDEDVMLEIGRDAVTIHTKTDIQGDLFVQDIDVLNEIEKVKVELLAELLGLSIALKTKYNKEGGEIFGPVEVKPNGVAGLTTFKVDGDGAQCSLPPVSDFHLTNKRYVDTTTIPFNMRKLAALPN